MKKSFKFLTILVATLLLISSLPLAAFAYETEDTEEENDTETVEETTAEQEETHESDLPAPPSSEESDNIHYELLPNGLIQATVYSGTGGIDTYHGSSSLIPGQIEFTDPSQGNDIMAGGSSNSEIIFDGSGSLDVMVDTYIEASNPSVNYGYSSEAVVSTSKIYYIQSPLPDFPEGATVVEAALRIAFVYDDKWESIDVNAHRVTGAWTESVLTWNVAKGMTRLGLEQRPMSITTIADPKGTSLTTPKYTTIDITAAASAWASGEAENYGVALKTSTSQQIIFKTSEAATAYRPYFVYTFQVPNPYSDGTYYMRNIGSEKYISINNEQTTGTIQISNFSVDDNKQWEVEFGSDGYYTIKSLESGKYIGVDPAYTSTVKLQNTLTNYTKWSIIETASGNYKLKCKATATTGYVLSAPSSGTDLIMTLYTEDQNYNDEWDFIEYVNFGDLTLNIGESTFPDIQFGNLVDDTDYIYTVTSGAGCINIDNDTGYITAVAAGTATVSAENEQYEFLQYTFSVHVNKNAIIIVPGIMGSVLVAGDNHSSANEGDVLWDSSLLSGSMNSIDLISRILSLRCNSDGTSADDVEPLFNSYGAGNTYEELYTSLQSEYGDRYDICFFAYDWRLSNEISGNKLDQYISDNQFDKVVLICHSMGGMVASSYLTIGQSQQEKVETLITIGTPFLGTPLMPYLWGSEDISSVISFESTEIPEFAINILMYIVQYFNVADVFLSNFKSIYELVPNEYYFDLTYGNDDYLVCSIPGTPPTRLSGFVETTTVLTVNCPYYRLGFASAANSFHSSMFVDNTHITQTVNTYYIAGYNSTTIDSIHFNTLTWNIYQETCLGDNTVPIISATLGNRFAENTFYVDGIGHFDLAKNPQVINFINQLISGDVDIDQEEFSLIHTDISQ